LKARAKCSTVSSGQFEGVEAKNHCSSQSEFYPDILRRRYPGGNLSSPGAPIDFLCLDVETANESAASICQIGIATSLNSKHQPDLDIEIYVDPEYYFLDDLKSTVSTSKPSQVLLPTQKFTKYSQSFYPDAWFWVTATSIA